MIMHGSRNSPFSTRIFIAAEIKGIEVELPALPAGGLRSEEFLALNPIAKIPVVTTESGAQLAESHVLLRYMEDRWPEPALLPSDPEERARIGLAIQLVDTYVMTSVIRLFKQMYLPREDRDAAVVENEVARWTEGAAFLSHYFGDGLPAAPAGLSMADCALPPAMHIATRVAAYLDLPQEPMKTHANLAAYYARIRENPVVGGAIGELTASQNAYDDRAGRASIAHWHAA